MSFLKEVLSLRNYVLGEYIKAQHPALIVFEAIVLYAITKSIYLLYFHPLSKYPGPRIAAISNIWYGYHWLSGRYPWAIEDVLSKYGDIVRIAPNELVFLTPQADLDIHIPHQKNQETFTKTDFNNRGKDLGGLIWEEDPAKHREIARKVAPAFSRRNLRAMEGTVNKYLDEFVAKMARQGRPQDGVNLGQWMEWLSMDMAADLAWSEKMYQMRDEKNSVYLTVLMGFNAFTTVIQVFKRFPLLFPLQFLFAPITQLAALKRMEDLTRSSILSRVAARDTTQHDDFFEHILPSGESLPTDRKAEMQIGSVAMQIMFASFGPIGEWFYLTLWFLLQEEDMGNVLKKEVREAFTSYDEITADSVTGLVYLRACLDESLRMMPNNLSGLPRISPGAMIDGEWIPKGVVVQSSIFSLARSEKYFTEPRQFRPQRWLPSSHLLFEERFANDNLKAFHPFSVGPRMCTGKEMAWVQGRLFLAKVVWMFDVVRVKSQKDVDLESDLKHFGFLVKPDVRVQFLPINRN